jgi:hypothetical protein
MLAAAAAKGGLAAARLLAVLKALGLGAAEDWTGAVDLIARASEGGHPAAMRELAGLGFASGVNAAARPLLRAAALKGDWIAGALGLRLGGVFTRAEASSLASRLKAANAPLLADGGAPADAAPAAPSRDDIAGVAEAAKAAAVPAAAPEVLRDAAPRIERIKGALSPFECDYVICAAARLLAPSAVVDPTARGAREASFRTSDGAAIGIVDLDLALFAVWRKLAGLAGAPLPNAELLGVLRYRSGEEYRPHHDFLPEDEADYSEVRRTGQRSHTLLVALNDAYEGGETVFPRIGVSWRGAVGEALHFENTANGAPIADSQHAGAPVKSGEKWLLSLWFRERRFWLW